MFRVAAALLLLAASAAPAQNPVVLHVDTASTGPAYHPVWNYFGADEANYSYSPNGSRLLGELSAMDPGTPVYFRLHNLLTSGDGTASLKWGSTGVYTETPDGKPVYDFTITDRLFDNLLARHIRPMVELGFMPEALSSHPEPYRHTFPSKSVPLFSGWTYPPGDFTKWRTLIVVYVQHLRQRYGSQVDSWLWEVWNEPDIDYWHGTPEQYLKLYDLSTGAVRQVLPQARVGGPAVTGDGSNKHFLQLFLEHCARGTNADTGAVGAPLDFISFHPKGAPVLLPSAPGTPAHVRMNLARQLTLTDRGFATIASFPEYRHTPIILSEFDPEGCAACKGPENGYRNGPLYGVSVAEGLVRAAELARARDVNLQGVVTWAFEFEQQPPFAGFRELATNAPLVGGGAALIDKPVLNVFRLLAKLHGTVLPLTSSGAVPLPQLLEHGVAANPDISGIATRSDHEIDVLAWNYQDEDLPAPPQELTIELDALPARAYHVEQYLVDAQHGNSYGVWQALGSPETLNSAQLTAIREGGSLKAVPATLHSPSKGGPLTLGVSLARQGVVLYRITW